MKQFINICKGFVFKYHKHKVMHLCSRKEFRHILCPKIKNKNAFTLMEVFVALSIFAIGILAIATMQISAIRGNDSARMLSEASTLAQDRLEIIIGLPYDHSDLDDSDNDGDAGLNDGLGAGEDWNTSSGIYEIYLNVAPDYPIDRSKTIRLFVKWTDRGRVRSLSMDYIKVDQI